MLKKAPPAGAWIEIPFLLFLLYLYMKAPPAGAWIEILSGIRCLQEITQSPSRRGVNWNCIRIRDTGCFQKPLPQGRELKLAVGPWVYLVSGSKPLPQGRELKYGISAISQMVAKSPSRRGVNWNKESEDSKLLVKKAPPAGAWIEICHQNRLFSQDIPKPFSYFQERQLKREFISCTTIVIGGNVKLIILVW